MSHWPRSLWRPLRFYSRFKICSYLDYLLDNNLHHYDCLYAIKLTCIVCYRSTN